MLHRAGDGRSRAFPRARQPAPPEPAIRRARITADGCGAVRGIGQGRRGDPQRGTVTAAWRSRPRDGSARSSARRHGERALGRRRLSGWSDGTASARLVLRALVTGATGLVGSYIVDRLVTDGWSARILVRSPASAEPQRARGIDIIDGNVLDGASFTRAAAGCDVVFHAAAAVSASGGWEEYRATNVEGTRNAIEAARSASARLMHVSSVAV